jgi:hypothetical protein
VNNVFTRIRRQTGGLVYDDHSSLKELKRSTANERLTAGVSWMIPGDWAKAGSGWLTRPLLEQD